MKVKLKDLKPNPFKKGINQGRLDESKVAILKESIEKDGFWDNIICRKNCSGYEIAYGHHRLEAAKQVFGKEFEIDIPCKKIDDASMLRILGNENNSQNSELGVYQIDQVVITKKFLESHVQPLDKPRNQYERDGIIGSRQISMFLGEKNWSKSKVHSLLIMKERLSPKIIEQMKSIKIGANSNGEISLSHARILSDLKDHKKQVEAVAKIKNLRLNREQARTLVKGMLSSKSKKIAGLEDKKLPTLEEYSLAAVLKINNASQSMRNITKHKNNMASGTRILLEGSLRTFENLTKKYFKGAE